MLIAGFPAQAFGTNCFVVAPAAGEECVVVDPGVGVEPELDEVLRTHRLRPVAVLLTHGHLDHTFSVAPVCGARGITAYVHPEDEAMLRRPELGISGETWAMFQGSGLTYAEPSDVAPLVEGETFEIAGLHIGVVHAPGHTRGSVLFGLPADDTAPHTVLSGDVLFAGSIGRTDLPGGSMTAMMTSLATTILPLDDATRVLPGHGPQTTIGQERATNPYLREAAASVRRGALMAETYRAARGTFDWLPPTSEQMLAVREGLAAPLRAAGYRYIETPTFEDTALFTRGVGGSTDIVSKEMYTFQTRGGDSVTLRPEGTAGVVRAALEASLHKAALPAKLWYSGSFYRFERPQKGRYRHFSQVGAEALGTEDPAVDAELIVLAVDAYAALGLRDVRLLLNTLGGQECRPAYRAALQEFLRRLDLDEETRARVELNPLRVLDDKRPHVQAQLVDAPLIVDYLCDACRAHHDVVRRLLADVGVEWVDDPRLVRGLDYYTRTTFEFVHDGLGSQSAVGGGGRYDGLSESIGGPTFPGVGWALGVDRTLLALEAEGVVVPVPAGVQVFVVPLGDAARTVAFRLATELRRAGVGADHAADGRGVKGAMKSADRSGARFAMVIGDRDLEAGVVQVKDLASGDQVAMPLADVVVNLQLMLRPAPSDPDPASEETRA